MSTATAAAPSWSARHPALSALWLGVSAGILAVVLGLAVVAIAVPRFLGAVPLTVLSGSMEPTLPVGTLIVVDPLDAQEIAELQLGDIVSFQPYPLNPTLVTHRITGITLRADGSRVFTTQGDANAQADAAVHDFQLRARMIYGIPWLGHVNQWLGAPQHAWVIPVVGGGLLLYAGCEFTVGVVRARRARRPDANVEVDARVSAA